VLPCGGRATGWGWGATSLPTSTKLRIPQWRILGVRLRGIISVVKRETAQTAG
jgi:hypothetical protein